MKSKIRKTRAAKYLLFIPGIILSIISIYLYAKASPETFPQNSRSGPAILVGADKPDNEIKVSVLSNPITYPEDNKYGEDIILIGPPQAEKSADKANNVWVLICDNYADFDWEIAGSIEAFSLSPAENRQFTPAPLNTNHGNGKEVLFKISFTSLLSDAIFPEIKLTYKKEDYLISNEKSCLQRIPCTFAWYSDDVFERLQECYSNRLPVNNQITDMKINRDNLFTPYVNIWTRAANMEYWDDNYFLDNAYPTYGSCQLAIDWKYNDFIIPEVSYSLDNWNEKESELNNNASLLLGIAISLISFAIKMIRVIK